MVQSTSDNPTEQDPFDALADEFIERLRRGEHPTIGEYVREHPQLAEEIRELFPTIASMERLKLENDRTASGRATLGPIKLDQLGDFQIVREIGRGGMGVVFEAVEQSLQRRVAVKVLPHHAMIDAKHLQRFHREARAAAGLHHTHIVPIFGAGQQDNLHYYVMQLVRGASLDRVIDHLRGLKASGRRPAVLQIDDLKIPLTDEIATRQADLSESQFAAAVARLGRQAAEALAYAHSRGIIHRDIKPANLILDEKGVLWITDFGLAAILHSQTHTASAQLTGTLRYMPPERFRESNDADNQPELGDVYSLGLTLYELLADQPAYAQTDRTQLLYALTHQAIKPLRQIKAAIPRDLETIVLKASAREPGHRYHSAANLADDLGRFLENRPITARRASTAEQVWRWCRRNRAVASLTAAVLALLLAVAIVASVGYWQTRQALAGQARQRARAEAANQLATEALDRIFDQFAPRSDETSAALTLDVNDHKSVKVIAQPVLSPQSAAVLQKLLAYYDRLAEEVGGPPEKQDVYRRKAADAAARVAGLDALLGQPKQAITAYDRAIKACDKLAADKLLPAGEAAITAAHLRNEQGNAYASLNETAKAKAAYKQALTRLDTAPDVVGRQLEMARTYYLEAKLGTPASQNLPPIHPAGNPGLPAGPNGIRADQTADHVSDHPASSHSANLPELNRAIALLTPLAAKSGVSQARYLLALCYRQRAHADLAGRDSSARDDLSKATTLLKNLVKQYPREARYSLALVETLGWVRHPGDPRGADPVANRRDQLKQAVALASQLVANHPNVPQYAAALVVSEFKFAMADFRRGRLAEAASTMQSALADQHMLAKRHGDVVSYQLWLAVIEQSMADILGRQGNHRQAKLMLEKASATLDRLKPDAVYASLIAQLKQAITDRENNPPPRPFDLPPPPGQGPPPGPNRQPLFGP